MKKNLFLSFLIAIMFSFILIGCSKANAYRSVKIFSFKGTCNIIRGKKQLDLAKEMKIKNEDELQVKEDSQAILKLDNDKFVCVKENTDVKFVATGKENNTKTRLHVNNGGVIVEVKEKLKDSESFEIASSNSVMAIRGTQISFDVSKTSDSITTTFSILTGTTETFLYKDETMNSTTLIHEKMMSYTTSLNKTTDEIYKLYDKFKPVDITETDLKEKYNTEIVDITNEKIDEIVNITNEFEREETKINKTIDFTIDSTLVYGDNPINSIKITDDINDLVNVKYLFSQDENGEFNETDNLSVGKWYVKIVADNAYESIVKEFNIIKKNVEFNIDQTIEYSDNLLSKISGVTDVYNLKISKTIDGIYQLYNINQPLELGTYYVKVESSNITSEPCEIQIVKKEITYTIPESVEYGRSLYEYVTSNVSDYDIYYIDDATAEYVLYNPTSNLELGTYTITLKKDDNYYYSSSKTVKVVKIEIDFDYDSTFDYDEDILDHIYDVSVDDYDIYYSTNKDTGFNIIPSSSSLDAGKYYIKLVSGSYYESKVVEITITTVNKGNFSIDDATYGDDLFYNISDVEFDSYYIYISDEIDGEYILYDYEDMVQNESIPEVGTYYMKIISLDGNYEYNPQEFSIAPASFDFSLSSKIDYGTSITAVISRPTIGTADALDLLISNSSDGEYREYDPNEILELGTYYIKAYFGKNFVSNVKEIEVVKIRADFYYTYEQHNTNGNAGVIVTINSTKYFNTSFAQEKDNEGNYKYYVVATYENNGEQSFVFDYDHRSFTVDNFGSGGSEAPTITFNYAYTMPDLVDVSNSTTTQTHEALVIISAHDYKIGYTNEFKDQYRVSAKLDFYKTDNLNVYMKYVFDKDSISFTTTTLTYDESLDLWYADLTISGTPTDLKVYYMLGESESSMTESTSSITFDLTIITGFDEDSFQMDIRNESIKTFNNDGTINIYRDLEFSDNTLDHDLVYEMGYGKYYIPSGEQDYLTFTTLNVVRSADTLFVLEDLDNYNYAFRYIHVIKVIDNVEYVVYSYNPDLLTESANAIIITSMSSPIRADYDYDNYDGYDVYAVSDCILPDEDGNMSVTIYYEKDPEEIYTYGFDNSSFGYEHSVDIKYYDQEEINITCSFTEAMTITEAFAAQVFGDADNQKIISSEQFDEIALYMEIEYDVIIKGTYYAERTNVSKTFSYVA